jgi:hypothetical protein
LIVLVLGLDELLARQPSGPDRTPRSPSIGLELELVVELGCSIASPLVLDSLVRGG